MSIVHHNVVLHAKLLHRLWHLLMVGVGGHDFHVNIYFLLFIYIYVYIMCIDLIFSTHCQVRQTFCCNLEPAESTVGLEVESSGMQCL